MKKETQIEKLAEIIGNMQDVNDCNDVIAEIALEWVLYWNTRKIQREAFAEGYSARDDGTYPDMTYSENVDYTFEEWMERDK